MNGPLAGVKVGRASVPGQSAEELSVLLANHSLGALERLSPPEHPALEIRRLQVRLQTTLRAHISPFTYLNLHYNDFTCLVIVISPYYVHFI